MSEAGASSLMTAFAGHFLALPPLLLYLLAKKGKLELREELKHIVEIQIVAFPQQGMYTYKGGRDLVEEALKMVADVVGGIPHYEPAREFGERSVHDIVKLAMKYDKPIDDHCDETYDINSLFVK